MKKLLTTKNALLFLGLVAIIQFVLLGVLWRSQTNTNNMNQQEFATMQQNLLPTANAIGYQPVTVSPPDSKIYLPQLSLSIPLTALGTSLLYSADTAYVTGSYGAMPTGPLDEAAITTDTTASMVQSQTQFNCSELVRIEFGAKPDPLNPSETSVASVSLANGKTLQVYAEHQKACQSEWAHTDANPTAIAALFKEAQSY